MRGALCFALISLIGLPLWSTSAAAELRRLGLASDGGPACTALSYCSAASTDACRAVPGSECLTLPGHSVSICSTLASPELEAFCCGGDSDCPSPAPEVAPACATVLGTPDGSPGVCLDTRKRWCVADPGAEIDFATLRWCLTPPTLPTAGAPLSWDTGDCDQDGVPNGEDGCPCVPGRADSPTPGCQALIADGGVRDAGPRDSGTDPTLDAGRSDAGSPVDDAGSSVDGGGVSAPDAAAPGDDAGGAPGDDAGPTGSFTGAGGCAASGARSGGTSFIWGLALLGLAFSARRWT